MAGAGNGRQEMGWGRFDPISLSEGKQTEGSSVSQGAPLPGSQ